MTMTASDHRRQAVTQDSAVMPVALFWGLDWQPKELFEPLWVRASAADRAEVLCVTRTMGRAELIGLLQEDPLIPVIFVGHEGTYGTARQAARHVLAEDGPAGCGAGAARGRDLREALTEAHAAALRLREVRAVMGRRRIDDDLYRLVLGFAYSRGNRIRAVIGVDRDTGFGYDVDTALAGATGDPGVSRPLLASLASSGYLDERLAETAHACPRCESIQLLLRDGCVSCGSPALATVDLVHHFRCGHQGPEAEFLTSTRLYICPKCRRELRHFGLDYDKPGQINLCERCGHGAEETAVQGRCLSCGSTFAASAAPKVRICDYELTEAGAHALFSGQARVFDPARVLGEHLPLMPLDVLYVMAHKLAALASRTGLQTLMICISFEERAKRRTGEGIRLLVKVGAELARSIRATDVAAYDRGDIYLLMPGATRADANAVRDRLLASLGAVFQDEIVDLLQWRSVPADVFLEASDPGAVAGRGRTSGHQF